MPALTVNKGDKYNYLRIIKEVEPKNGNKRRFLCRCTYKNCKTRKEFDLDCLRQLTVKSCGCYNREKSTKNGLSRHPLYSVYNNMISRCYNKKHKSYKDYGGRGITVCKEWKEKKDYKGLKAFVKWALNNGWKKGLELDRINTKKDSYCLEKCRFITKKKNLGRKRNTKYIKIKGKKLRLIKAWEKYSPKELSYKMVCERIRNGWSKKKAIFTPINKNKRNKRYAST